MLPNVPPAVAAYLAAEKIKDANALARCFADDGTVRDEGRLHRGPDAIAAWKRAADEKYRFVVDPLDAAGDERAATVRARVSGDFPGSPAELRFAFALAGDRIASLEIR